MSADYFDIATSILRNNAAVAEIRQRAKQIVMLSFDCFEVEVTYHMEGWAHSATEDSPAERPVPHVDECVVSCGDWNSVVPFALLSQDVRDQVEEVIANEEGQS